jgi:hypothetical protein
MNIKTLTIACGLAVSLLGQPALVGQFEDGVVAANRENH